MEIWVKPLADGRYAAMLFNPTDKPQDITLDFSRDLPDAAAKWARDVEALDECKDTNAWCDSWAKGGECEKNPGES